MAERLNIDRFVAALAAAIAYDYEAKHGIPINVTVTAAKKGEKTWK